MGEKHLDELDAAYYPSQEVCCNLCGKPLTIADIDSDYSIHGQMGYGSTHDGEIVHLRICADCMDQLIDRCMIPCIEQGDGNEDN